MFHCISKVSSAPKVFHEMFSPRLAGGAMIVRTIRPHALVQAIRPPRAGGCFASVSTSPPEGGSERVGEKAKQTMDDVLGATKDSSQKLKERVTGTGAGTGTGTGTGTGLEKPSRDPELNHGVESTDSSCEDVRGRPGGYS